MPSEKENKTMNFIVPPGYITEEQVQRTQDVINKTLAEWRANEPPYKPTLERDLQKMKDALRDYRERIEDADRCIQRARSEVNAGAVRIASIREKIAYLEPRANHPRVKHALAENQEALEEALKNQRHWQHQLDAKSKIKACFEDLTKKFDHQTYKRLLEEERMTEVG